MDFDLELRWSEYLQAIKRKDPTSTLEEIERDLLDGNTLDLDDPYLVDLALRILEQENNGEPSAF